MPNRSSKRPRDTNELAYQIVMESTGQATPEAKPAEKQKNPAAVALGKLGGMKGGKARAEALSPAKRKAIAKKAAQARWKS